MRLRPDPKTVTVVSPAAILTSENNPAVDNSAISSSDSSVRSAKAIDDTGIKYRCSRCGRLFTGNNGVCPKCCREKSPYSRPSGRLIEETKTTYLFGHKLYLIAYILMALAVFVPFYKAGSSSLKNSLPVMGSVSGLLNDIYGQNVIPEELLKTSISLYDLLTMKYSSAGLPAFTGAFILVVFLVAGILSLVTYPVLVKPRRQKANAVGFIISGIVQIGVLHWYYRSMNILGSVQAGKYETLHFSDYMKASAGFWMYAAGSALLIIGGIACISELNNPSSIAKNHSEKRVSIPPKKDNIVYVSPDSISDKEADLSAEEQANRFTITVEHIIVMVGCVLLVLSVFLPFFKKTTGKSYVTRKTRDLFKNTLSLFDLVSGDFPKIYTRSHVIYATSLLIALILVSVILAVIPKKIGTRRCVALAVLGIVQLIAMNWCFARMVIAKDTRIGTGDILEAHKVFFCSFMDPSVGCYLFIIGSLLLIIGGIIGIGKYFKSYL